MGKADKAGKVGKRGKASRVPKGRRRADHALYWQQLLVVYVLMATILVTCIALRLWRTAILLGILFVGGNCVVFLAQMAFESVPHDMDASVEARSHRGAPLPLEAAP